MKRRHFVQSVGALGMTTALGFPACTSCYDAEFIILGGGISGLSLAYQLEKAGKDYILLEGSPRLGGRLFTHEGLQNREVGGRGIGDKYIELMKLVEELDVDLIDITDYMRSPTSIYYKGKLHKDWTSDQPNPRLLEYQLATPAPALTTLEEWYQRPDLDKAYADQLVQSGKTQADLDVINISANYNDVRETSAINALHSAAFRKFNGSKRIYNFKDGSKTLIDKVVNKLTKPVHLNKMVTSISDTADCITVTCEDGSKYCSSKMISTLPFSTLRDVEMDVTFSANQKKAINELGYTLITQIHVQPTAAFWEEDGFHIDMWTDTPLERVMNTSAIQGNHELVCWVNGKGTAFIDKMSDLEIKNFTLEKLKEIRPSTEGKLEYVGTHSWGKYKYNKGAYAEFQVGQAALFEDMIRPSGNMHFAGEHTARASRGIEGAAESAMRVFKELVA